MWKVEYSHSAAKALLRLPRNLATLIRGKIDNLAADPHAVNANVRPLKGRPASRLRVGGWRVIYELDRGRVVILVLDIGPRGRIYE